MTAAGAAALDMDRPPIVRVRAVPPPYPRDRREIVSRVRVSRVNLGIDAFFERVRSGLRLPAPLHSWPPLAGRAWSW
jgi:hypothetical protein